MQILYSKNEVLACSAFSSQVSQKYSMFFFWLTFSFYQKENVKRKSRQLPHNAESDTQAAAYLWGVVRIRRKFVFAIFLFDEICTTQAFALQMLCRMNFVHSCIPIMCFVSKLLAEARFFICLGHAGFFRAYHGNAKFVFSQFVR